MRARTIFLATSIWSFAPTATAQRAGGVSVIGSVVDQTGAVLPFAQVELRSETGTVQSAAANQDGEFTFIAVASGRYTVVASFDGFQTTSVRLTVGARAPSALRITLPPATLTQEVTVGNAAADVRADATSNLDASTVDQRTLEKPSRLQRRRRRHDVAVSGFDVDWHKRRHADRQGRRGELADAAGIGHPTGQDQSGSVRA